MINLLSKEHEESVLIRILVLYDSQNEHSVSGTGLGLSISHSYFSNCIKALYGMSPTEYVAQYTKK